MDRYRALQENWTSHPPAHLILAAVHGLKPKETGDLGDFLMFPDGKIT